jgi:hypothetical protein
MLINKADAQKIIDEINQLEDFINNFQGADSQADFTTIQATLAAEGLTFPGLQTGITQQLVAKYGGDAIKILEALKRIIARLNGITLPTPAPVAPVTPPV